MEFYQQHHDWLIGRFNYDLKNHVEKLSSDHVDRVNSPDLYFFVPETLIFILDGQVEVHSAIDPEKIWNEISHIRIQKRENRTGPVFCDTTGAEYLSKVARIKEQILEGDFYELNYCLEYYCENVRIHPPEIYHRLNRISPMPMSVFQGLSDHYIMSASPERFLKKSGRKLIAQPIKGTIRRDPDPVADEILKNKLRNSEKEIAENMMIVDLMRNDLGKSAVPGSVEVPELFGIYTFSHLHQMISTITCRLQPEVHPVQAIRNAFPMGSMTGAPKIRAMQEIEKYESSKRGSFSGAAGYFSPDENFDFNVLIRSIFYNKSTGSLKFNVGSAITHDARGQEEYAECQLKAKAIMEVLTPA
ncbi:MAG: anthranilate synthase component I family protein [Cyclobacteriaceae bacterium]|nr:anthranilate synthase component I family protein [Cyclobacteriaceae bacterium]